jgi:hypothetical protein
MLLSLPSLSPSSPSPRIYRQLGQMPVASPELVLHDHITNHDLLFELMEYKVLAGPHQKFAGMELQVLDGGLLDRRRERNIKI